MEVFLFQANTDGSGDFSALKIELLLEELSLSELQQPSVEPPLLASKGSRSDISLLQVVLELIA